MNQAEKIRFVDSLIANVARDIVANVPRMPEDWDGHELRRYIADKFEESAMTIGKDKQYRRRFLAYRNEVIVRNL